MAIEDMTAFFHVGLSASCRPNALTAQRIMTSLEPDESGRLSIPYIQGVARIPEGFDRVAEIEQHDTHVRLVADSGQQVEVACRVNFVFDGELPQCELTS
jgi:hypothetical protein